MSLQEYKKAQKNNVWQMHTDTWEQTNTSPTKNIMGGRENLADKIYSITETKHSNMFKFAVSGLKNGN
jgi:hypothetical protein